MKHQTQIQKDDERGYFIWWGTEYSNPYSSWIGAYVESKPPYNATVSCQLLNSENKDEYRKSNFKKLDDSINWCLNTISKRLTEISKDILVYNIKDKNDDSNTKLTQKPNKRIK